MKINKEFRRRNHYVPQFYLKNWSNDKTNIYGYRTLVSSDQINDWKKYPISGIAYYTDLYTHFSNDNETDEIERWLSEDFENPAAIPLIKAVSDDRLTPEDWKNLIKFVAAQYVRTPARIEEWFTDWKIKVPKIIQSVLENLKYKLEKGNQKVSNQKFDKEDADSIQIAKVSISPYCDGYKQIALRTDINRSMWLYGVQHILKSTYNVLLTKKWHVLKSHPDVHFFTSDDPVICLNYYKDGSFNFKGGWDCEGSEIIFPISPRHVIYTQIKNKKCFCKNLSKEMSIAFQNIIAKHAYRWIFASEPFSNVSRYRKRTISIEDYRYEENIWKEWHIKHGESEQDIANKCE